MSRDIETIAALASPPGIGALAIIRVSGEKAFSIAASCISSRIPFTELAPRIASLCRVTDPQSGKMIDNVIVVKYSGPASYTGEDLVEITSHGGVYIIEKILSILVSNGARYATRGEFTLRAFRNGKMDLVKAESVQELIASRSGIQHEIALSTYNGAYQTILEALKRDLLSVISDIEAGIEYPEESDVADKAGNETVQRKISKSLEFIKSEIEKRKKIKAVEGGIRIVITGRTNVGKSSLFNYLLQKERSLVHWQSGTTRDYISEQLLISDIEVQLIDTAGIRTGADPVEEMGIQRTKELIKDAQLIILTCAANESWSEWEENIFDHARKSKVLIIINKADLGVNTDLEDKVRATGVPCEKISLKTKNNIVRAIQQIEKQIREIQNTGDYSCVIINTRQEMLMKQIAVDLAAALENISSATEIAAEHLKNAIDMLGEFCGATSSENILNNIFSKFCVGK